MPENRIEPKDKKYWFPAKKYGWGWGPPRCWQGWLILGSYLALLAAGEVSLMTRNSPLPLVYALFLSLLLLVICFIKGEKPRWRWGKD